MSNKSVIQELCEPIQVLTLDQCKKRVKENWSNFGERATGKQLPKNEVNIRANHIRKSIQETANFTKQFAKTISEMDPTLHPVDQGRSFNNDELQKYKEHPFIHPEWILVRRWPWIAVFQDGSYDSTTPPWNNAWILSRFRGYNRAIAECLSYCLENSAYLPRIAPTKGSTSFDRFSNQTDLPNARTVAGRWIPRGIVDKFRTARCGESLAFVFQFTGSDEIEKIRQLIIAPTHDKIGEAYAIATSIKFETHPVAIADLIRFSASGKPKKPVRGPSQATISLLRALHTATRPLTYRSIANAAGVNPRTAERILSKFNRDGFITEKSEGWVLSSLGKDYAGVHGPSISLT